MKIDIIEITVKNNDVRRYGKQFYSYASISYGDIKINDLEPFPSSNFPKYEGVSILLMRIEGLKQISEREFRQLFKGVKNGAELYSQYAFFLENNHNVEFN